MYDQRISRLQNWMDEQGVEGTFATTPATVAYLTGFFSNPHERLMGCLVPRSGKAVLVVPLLDAGKAKAKGTATVVTHTDTEKAADVFRKTVEDVIGSVKALAIEKQHMTVGRWEELQSIFADVKWVRADEPLLHLRLRKDASELAIMRKAARLADGAVEAAIRSIAVGKTEFEIVHTIENFVKMQGAERVAFDTMVLTGLKSGLPHGTPGNDKIRSGDFVLIDMGVVIDQYCSDITRTFVVGEPTQRQRDIYETVRQANEAAIKKVRPGIQALEIDAAARQVITEKGYGEYFTHRVGHGLGIDVHEEPSMHGQNETLLETGMVFTIEPGIYLPDVGGVRIEDDVYVTEDGVEVLTSFPKDLQIL